MAFPRTKHALIVFICIGVTVGIVAMDKGGYSRIAYTWVPVSWQVQHSSSSDGYIFHIASRDSGERVEVFSPLDFKLFDPVFKEVDKAEPHYLKHGTKKHPLLLGSAEIFVVISREEWENSGGLASSEDITIPGTAEQFRR